MPKASLIFVGSGSSTGTPRIGCLLDMQQCCEVCKDAMLPESKNRRRNPSILIQYNGKNILIDCGKTFRESMIQCITKHKINALDAILISHAHADAFLGLDDVREFLSDAKGNQTKSLPVYIRSLDIEPIRKAFPYLFDRSKATGSGYVSQIDFISFDQSQPLNIEGLEIMPIEVEHGKNNTALAFKFGNNLYISDVSDIPASARELMQTDKGVVDLLIIDALFMGRQVTSHFSLDQALNEIRKIRPRKSYLIGMSHDFHYDKVNAQLSSLKEQEQLDVECAYDGLCITIQI